MTDEKKKVKDVAAELNVPVKDLLNTAKELGILAAKVSASSLSEAEVARLKNHYAPASDKPEVIVRRRKKESGAERSLDKSDAVEASSPKAEAQLEKTVEKQEKNTPQKTKVVQGARVVSRPNENEVGEPVVSVVPVNEKTNSAQPVADVESEKKEPAPQKATETPVEESVPADTKNAARVVRPAAFSAEPEKNAEGETVSSAPATMPSRQDSLFEGEPETAASPQVAQVRVISRPEAQPPRKREDQGQPQRPRQNTGARPAGQRPSHQRPPASQGAKPGSGQPPRQNQNFPHTPQPQPAVAAGEGAEQGRKKRQKGRRTVEFGNNRMNDGDDFGWSKTSRGKKGRKQRDNTPLGGTQPMKAAKRVIKVGEFIRVSDLAHQMGLKSGEIIKVLFNLGVMATINQSLDVDTATLVAGEFGYEIEKAGFFEEEVLSAQQEVDKEEDLLPRPPVVTIMGHVDHGKTSLLDALRKASVASGEAGGITQHIGAYHVTTKRGDIVFLDTPGHEAFTAMRARGAEITDIVVLVVAADDGVMEQTREAISHAKAAHVPIMVAVNKMDKPEANPDRVKRELSEQGLVAEDWGGDTTFSYVSAKTGEGLDGLLELLALQAEVLELKANPNKSATGHIVEAKLDKGRGSLGTVLIQQGTLRLGDPFVCGVHSGRVRAMFNDQGKKVKEAGPSMPVEVQGFEGVPEAGEEFVSIADEKTARRIAEARALKQRERELAKESKVTLETFLARKPSDVEAVVLNLVVKSDVQGSLEAINDALLKMSTEKVRINLMHGGTGAISESDVLLASASNAIIIGFNVRPTAKAKELAEAEKVDMRFYDVIYKLVEEIKGAMEGMLAPVEKEVFLGTADVREVFSVPKVGVIAGCHVSEGKIIRNSLARLLRDGVVIYTGKASSLRRFKDDVREVAKGYECGIGLENYNDIKVGDVIEAYEIVEEAAKL